MRTTIDIPDGLLRRVKAEAALRGMKLKDYVTRALRASLDPAAPAGVAEPEPELGRDELILGDDCVFPVIRGKTGSALENVTPRTLGDLLTEEEIERALDSR